LIKKVTKNQVNRHLLLYAQTLARQSDKTTGCNTLLHCRSLMASASVKFANALSHAQATIVLSDFARSWSIDGVHLMLLTLLNELKTKAGKGTSEKRARVFCLQRGSFFLIDLFAFVYF